MIVGIVLGQNSFLLQWLLHREYSLMDADIPYLLLTPGPLTTSRRVKQVMMQDFCTWDDDYHQIVTDIRQRLVRLAEGEPDYTSVLLAGSGTYAVEATLGSVVGRSDKVLIVDNGAYGRRMVEMARYLHLAHVVVNVPETSPVTPEQIEQCFSQDASITHLALVHCETTTGLLNPAAAIGALANAHCKLFIVDAMSSFGGIPLCVEDVGADYLISSSNKCVQGVPGFAFVVARRSCLEKTRGTARSLSLDLYDQWREMESRGGKWRYTSPTHVVRAFQEALRELDDEGGVTARFHRYSDNQRQLVDGLADLGIQSLIERRYQSPIITSFLYPADARFTFEEFYRRMKERRFVLYPGKVSQAPTFRIGTIGHVFPEDIQRLVRCVSDVLDEMGIVRETRVAR